MRTTLALNHDLLAKAISYTGLKEKSALVGEALKALHSLHPAFGEARVLRLAAALRPALDNHRPTLAQRDGVWHLNGLFRHGYLCAPALVDQLVQHLLPTANRDAP